MPIRLHKSAAITRLSPPYRAPILIMTIPASLPLETALVTNRKESLFICHIFPRLHQLSFSTIFCKPSFQFLVFWFTPCSQLFSSKVRIIDFDKLNLHLILHSQVHSNILSSPDFILDNIVKSSANIGNPKDTQLMKTPTFVLLSTLFNFIYLRQSALHNNKLSCSYTSYVQDVASYQLYQYCSIISVTFG